jgi:hypothetical protein
MPERSVDYYTIYHLPGRKCECADDLDWRLHVQELSRSDVEVVDRVPKSLGPEFASQVEMAWNRWFGYANECVSETTDIASVLAELRREEFDEYDRYLIKNNNGFREVLMLIAQRQRDFMDGLIPELVSLAAVPPTGYRGFCLGVHKLLMSVDHRTLSTFRDEAMLRVEAVLRAAQDAILALSEEQRMQVRAEVRNNLLTARNPELALSLRWDRVIPDILEGIGKITGSAPYRPTDPGRRGPKQKERMSVKLRDFIRGMWSSAEAHGGGFTVTSQFDLVGSGTHAVGTLVDALRLLEPVLPPGFVSNLPSASTLNRCRPGKK